MIPHLSPITVKPEPETRELERQKLEERRARDMGKFFDWLENRNGR